MLICIRFVDWDVEYIVVGVVELHCEWHELTMRKYLFEGRFGLSLFF